MKRASAGHRRSAFHVLRAHCRFLCRRQFVLIWGNKVIALDMISKKNEQRTYYMKNAIVVRVVIFVFRNFHRLSSWIPR